MIHIPLIDLSTQYQQLKIAMTARIQTVLNHGQYILGPEVAELEHILANYVGVKHAIGVASGTTALQLALMALGIGPSDEVITTPFTFMATGEIIAMLGATPVFVDIDPISWNLDPDRIEAAITAKTRAILPVSLYGHCADFNRINSIANQHGLAVIEDGAQSFGARYHQQKSCGLSTLAATSFFPSKPLGCYGDGGACFTNDDTLAQKIRQLRVHGQAHRYHHTAIGLNGRLDTLQAAILLAKWPSFNQEITARERIGARYSALLKDYVQVPVIAAGCSSVYAQFTIAVEQRDAIQAALTTAGIGTAVHYPLPLHRQAAFAHLHLPEGSLPHAEGAARRVLSLPMHPFLDDATQDKIIATVIQAVTSRDNTLLPSAAPKPTLPASLAHRASC